MKNEDAIEYLCERWNRKLYNLYLTNEESIVECLKEIYYDDLKIQSLAARIVELTTENL